jgi:hypothetical protein
MKNMRNPYSRLASVEERRNIKSTIIFISLTIVTIVLLFFVGIPILGRFTAFISDLGKSNKPITTLDTTPPAPPKFNTFSDFTNQENVSIAGTAEPGATVNLTFNGVEKNTLSDTGGNFSFSQKLNEGENHFSAVAVDSSGNESQRTKDLVITFDKKAPDLTIDSPGDGSQFFGSKQRQVTIVGTTESTAGVTINDRIISVDDNGKFQYTTTLNDGENKFTVKSTDQAGNVTEKSLTLTFSS